MKNLINTITAALVIIVMFTSCEPDTVIKDCIIEVEVPVVEIDSVLVQESSFGTITYTQIAQGNNLTLSSGLNHYAHVSIERYRNFDIDMRFSLDSET